MRQGSQARPRPLTFGELAPGFAADVAVLDTDPFAEGSAALLTSRVLATVVAGRVAFADEEVRPG